MSLHPLSLNKNTFFILFQFFLFYNNYDSLSINCWSVLFHRVWMQSNIWTEVSLLCVSVCDYSFINGLKNSRAIPNHLLRCIPMHTYVCTLIYIIKIIIIFTLAAKRRRKGMVIILCACLCVCSQSSWKTTIIGGSNELLAHFKLCKDQK